MKFGKIFDHHKVPEWADSYLDYKKLKKILRRLRYYKKDKVRKSINKNILKAQVEDGNVIELNEVIHERGHSYVPRKKDIGKKKKDPKTLPLRSFQYIESYFDGPEEVLTPNEIKDLFIEAYKNQVKKVEKFIKSQISKYNEELEKMKKYLNSRKPKMLEAKKLKNQKSQMASQFKLSELSTERDDLGFAVSWGRAFSHLYNNTSWLHSYVSINSIAMQKIIKKYNKILKKRGDKSKCEIIEKFNKTIDLNFELECVTELRTSTVTLYADELKDGDIFKAKDELDDRMGGAKRKNYVMIGFYVGMIFSLIIAIFIIENLPVSEITRNDSMIPFFPMFNFGLCFISLIFGTAWNIYMFRKYRINYVYIFEIDPKVRLGHVELFKTGFFLLNIWMILFICFKVSLSDRGFEGKFYLFPYILLLCIITFLIWPFHQFYLRFRIGLFWVFLKQFRPVGKTGVRFRDFLLTDVFTSFTRPITSLILGVCLFSCKRCEEENIRMDCNRTTVMAFVISFLPWFLRTLQCINRYYYTRMFLRHMGNALKYLGGCSNIVFTWLFQRNPTNQNLKITFIIVAFISQSYMLFWDFYMGWNLCRRKSKNFLLRNKIIYPKSFYYWAMATNLCLRYTWLTAVFQLKINGELLVFLLSIGEIYRRFQWTIIRVESEMTYNPDKYRTILDIPELTIH